MSSVVSFKANKHLITALNILSDVLDIDRSKIIREAIIKYIKETIKDLPEDVRNRIEKELELATRPRKAKYYTDIAKKR